MLRHQAPPLAPGTWESIPSSEAALQHTYDIIHWAVILGARPTATEAVALTLQAKELPKALLALPPFSCASAALLLLQ